MAEAVGFKASRRMSPIRSRPGAPSRASTSRSRRAAQAGATNDVDGLQQQCETYTKRIEMEKRRGEELDKKLAVSRWRGPRAFDWPRRQRATRAATRGLGRTL